jgi:hypothetical protein
MIGLVIILDFSFFLDLVVVCECCARELCVCVCFQKFWCLFEVQKEAHSSWLVLVWRRLESGESGE